MTVPAGQEPPSSSAPAAQAVLADLDLVLVAPAEDRVLVVEAQLVPAVAVPVLVAADAVPVVEQQEPLVAGVLRADRESRSALSAKNMKCAKPPVLAAYRSLVAMARQ